MDAWSVYENRIAVHGGSKRDASLIREKRLIHSKLPDNLSYHSVDIYPREHGFNIESETEKQFSYSQNVAIINSDNLNEKFIYSLPEEDIELGSLIFWMGNRWLVCERDVNTTVYTRSR